MKAVFVLVVAATAGAFWYAFSCWVWPFAPCPHCRGAGRRSRRGGRIFRDCWWCSGSGRRLRLGRRVWNFFEDRRRRA